MNIINANTLTQNQYNDARRLIEACKEKDNSRGISFFEQEMNENRHYPCFYMIYDENELVAFASVFIPNENGCEVYANVLPRMRNRGYFTRMLTLIRKNNEKYGINTMYIVNDPACESGTMALKSMNAIYTDSEFLMRYDNHIIPNPKGILDIVCEKGENNIEFIAFLEDEEVGHCYVEYVRECASIYGFYIEEEYRNRGYGTEMLLQMIKNLLEHGSEKILLHVNGANVAAYKMYYNHGFTKEEQIDYWRL